jgi:hypothetical protein
VHIADLCLGRANATAITMPNGTIYIAGGAPLETVSQTCERYFVNEDRWEIVNVKFPCVMVNFGMVGLSDT